MIASLQPKVDALERFLQEEQAKDLLRLTTAGSVDDGKSTLIGRLLYDSHSLYQDQLESVTKASIGRNAGGIDFSLLTDGLRAEREQAITIDVAYRFFATRQRKFIIADTPGHEQYTRNMVTGASTADLAVVLIDGRRGVQRQSRRHLLIAELLGVPHLVIVVNKMDLVGYTLKTFELIKAECGDILSQFRSKHTFIPISALLGDNVVSRSEHMPWYDGPSLLDYLHQVPVNDHAKHKPFRFAVQHVVHPHMDFRGYAGTVNSGSARPGDAVTVYPSKLASRVHFLHTFDGNINEASAGSAVTITLEDELDVSRGDLLAGISEPPSIAKDLEATVVWLGEAPGEVGKRYRIKHTTRQAWATIRQINYQLDIDKMSQVPGDSLAMNAIGSIRLEMDRPLIFDPYTDNRITGSFILIDPITNYTIAAAMIQKAVEPSQVVSPVQLQERIRRQCHRGAIVRLAGRWQLARRLERWLFDRGCTVFLFEEPSDEVSKLLLRSGALVTLTQSNCNEMSIESAEGTIRFPDLNDSKSDDDVLAELQDAFVRHAILES